MSQCRRVLRAYVPARFADPSPMWYLTADTFTRFVTGQLIEACILGGLCAARMLFIRPTTPLLSASSSAPPPSSRWRAPTSGPLCPPCCW